MAFSAIHVFNLYLTCHFIVLCKTLHFLQRNLLEKIIMAKLVFNVENNMCRGASHRQEMLLARTMPFG